MKRTTAVRLPSVRQSSQQVLAEYASPLMAELERISAAAPIAEKVRQGARALQDVLHSREVCERLAVQADERAAEAELAAEAGLRALYATLSKDARAGTAVFPDGLAGALSPRGQAQAAEVTRLLSAIARLKSAPPSAAAVTSRLAAAGSVLSQRLAAAAAAHVTLVGVAEAEQRQRRAFRALYHQAYGEIVALRLQARGRLAQLFHGPSPARDAQGIPLAPPTTTDVSRRRRARRGAR